MTSKPKTRPLTKEEEEAAAEEAMIAGDLIDEIQAARDEMFNELVPGFSPFFTRRVPLRKPHTLKRLTDDTPLSWHDYKVDHAEVRMTAGEFADFLIKEGYYQISRRWRILGRLPNGKDGTQALLDIVESDRQYNHEEWARLLSERDAGDHFLRCHAGVRGNVGKTIEVDPATFAEYRKRGGGTYR